MSNAPGASAETAARKARDPKVSKREFTKRFAARAGVPVRIASTVYEAMIAELLEIVANDESVVLTGFGRFYPQQHKGHKVKYSKPGEDPKPVDDYTVLKFSATRAVNKSVKADDDDEDEYEDEHRRST